MSDKQAELKERCKAYNMRVICEKAGISYAGFRQWKRDNMKLKDEDIDKLNKAMDEA